MTSSPENNAIDIWTQIYYHCQQLEKSKSAPGKDTIGVQEMLTTILETHDKQFDPVDDYPEYVMVMLCKTILNATS